MGRAWLNPSLAPKPKAEEVEGVSRGQVFFMLITSFFPLAFLILSVLGAILAGLATPSEAASVGALGGLLLAICYRVAAIVKGEVTVPWAAEGRDSNKWLEALGIGALSVSLIYVAYVSFFQAFRALLFDTPVSLKGGLFGGPFINVVLAILLGLAITFLGERNELIGRFRPKSDAGHAMMKFAGQGALFGGGLGVLYIIAMQLGLADIARNAELNLWALDVGIFVGAIAWFAWRTLEHSVLRDSVYLTVRTSAMVCWLFVGSWTFSSVFSYLGGEQLISDFVIGLNLSPIMFLIMAQLIIFLLGWPLEWSEIIIIFVPIFLPPAATFRDRPAVLRDPGGAQPADLVPHSAHGHGGLLPEGRVAARGSAGRDLQGRAAISLNDLPGHVHPLRLSGDRPVAAGADLRPMSSLCELSAAQAVAKLAGGEISARSLTETLLARIAEVDPAIEAWQFLDGDYALAQADLLDQHRQAGRPIGSLHGLPVAVKDIIDTRDMPSEYGTPLHAGRRPEADATVVAKLRAAGALILGKTVTAELAYRAPGKTRNPHNPAHTPGGSSSGSAAAVSAGMVPLALGSQTAGSVIRPASFCGVCGFKPSHGLISRHGMLGLSRTLDTVGGFGRSVEDLALLVDALAGHDPQDSDTRLEAAPRLAKVAATSPPLRPLLALVKQPAWEAADDDLQAGFGELAETPR